ncbi:hypothetical protein QJS10_CPB19g00896 [Acorus calamus]|uniref:NADH dehydrogenase-like complex L n=1 Tax=Acorus calamus TaxID=4465 RepID=A0AAV9CFX1_ACOCL|nr:hypothetical protein QJS10_CPB19g00896 [Acorus calamus]
MSSSWSSGSLNLLSLPTKPACSSLMVKSKITQPSISKSNKARMQCSHCWGESIKQPSLEKSSLAIHFGALLAFIEQPTLAVTGENNYEDDLTWTLISSAIVAFWYLLVMPPIILNWLRLRWYKRNLLEMYLQFMCVFLFFPGILLWAPFLNFRRLPRDPDMKYPWSTPQDTPRT